MLFKDLVFSPWPGNAGYYEASQRLRYKGKRVRVYRTHKPGAQLPMGMFDTNHTYDTDGIEWTGTSLTGYVDLLTLASAILPFCEPWED